MSRKTRSKDVLFQFSEDIFRRREILDLSKVQQLPTIKYVIERYFTIKDELPKTKKDKEKNVLSLLVSELRFIWIYMNIPCLSYSRVRKKVKDICSKIDYLKRVAEAKRQDKWKQEVHAISSTLMNGFDIRCDSSDVEEEMEILYGVKVSEEEIRFHRDNCLLIDETGNKLNKCERKIWCGEVDSKWWEEMLKRKEKLEKDERFQSLMELRRSRQNLEITQVSSEIIDDDSDQNYEYQYSDEEYVRPTFNNSWNSDSPATRSGVTNKESPYETDSNYFPQLSVRTGYRTIDINIMETLVVMISVFKVDERKCTALLAFIANKLFHQKWTVPESDEGKNEDNEGKNEDNERDDSDNEIEDAEPSKKRRKKVGDLEFALPARKVIRKWVGHFSLLSLKDAGTQITLARISEKVVNYGVDDTTKAAGNKKHDMKGAHLTIVSKRDSSRESFSTGFNPNVSHSGIEAARTVKYDIAKLAVLTGNTYEAMVEMIDFFMSDRAGDNDLMLDELDIDESRRLKCNAHVILCVGASLEKVFRDAETLIGKSNLISSGAAHVFSSTANSIWYLGLIALAKLVSPSHMKESVSLYKSYVDFLKENIESSNDYEEQSRKCLKTGFKGFVSNRFGRVGELSKASEDHKELLDAFFDQQVDIHSNKLVLAVDAYLKSFWFMQCCKIAGSFYEQVVIPMKKVIGIDEFKKVKGDRSWTAIKKEFERIISVLDDIEKGENKTGNDQLKIKCAREIRTAITRQLSKMKFFSENVSESIDMKGAIPTNLGCEGEFASADNDFRRTGGSVSLQTISNRHIISRNQLYSKDRWKNISLLEKKEQWHWARNSDEAKKIREMEKEFNDRIEGLNKLSIEAKIEKKKKNDKKLIDALELCKKHGGPLTPNDINKLDDMSDDQVLAEAKYWKRIHGGGSAIRFSRKVDNKFVRFTTSELRQQIRDVILPYGEPIPDTDELLRAALKKDNSNEEDDYDDVGIVGWWDGPVGQKRIGIVMNSCSIQLFTLKRYGFVPDQLLEPREGWRLAEQIEEFHYEENQGRVFLII